MFLKLKTRLKYLDENEVEVAHKETDKGLTHDEMNELITHFRGIRNRLNDAWEYYIYNFFILMEVLSTQLKLLQDKSQEKRNMAMKDIE